VPLLLLLLNGLLLLRRFLLLQLWLLQKQRGPTRQLMLLVKGRHNLRRAVTAGVSMLMCGTR